MALKISNPKRARRWLRYATTNGVETTPRKLTRPRKPTDIEHLAAHGYTRRVNADGTWFEGPDGQTTPICETLDAATRAALEAIGE